MDSPKRRRWDHLISVVPGCDLSVTVGPCGGVPAGHVEIRVTQPVPLPHGPKRRLWRSVIVPTETIEDHALRIAADEGLMPEIAWLEATIPYLFD